MILREKADQVQPLLHETGLDCWLTFARESGLHPDPGLDLVVGCDVTWLSAFLFHRDGRRIAIVGRYDVANVRDAGVFSEILSYDEDVRPPLLDALCRLNPSQIGLNYSTDNYTADGLTHGLYLALVDLLRDTPFLGRLTSAAPLLAKLRARKSPTEIACIRLAVATAEEVVAELTPLMRVGLSERDIADRVHEMFRARGVVPAWDPEACPIVNSGPASEPGHTKPNPDIRVEPGHLIHVDLGVKQEGYCSDLQRMWYVRRAGETAPPDEVRRAFAAVAGSIDAAARVLKPGAVGADVDAAARSYLIAAGYPEYKHGTGHGLGRAVHDGGTLLGPRWPKYGSTPDGIVEIGNVFTLELGVATSAGFVGLEEDVVVTANGCEFLSSFPREPVWI